jgi:hypothetical protein
LRATALMIRSIAREHRQWTRPDLPVPASHFRQLCVNWREQFSVGHGSYLCELRLAQRLQALYDTLPLQLVAIPQRHQRDRGLAVWPRCHDQRHTELVGHGRRKCSVTGQHCLRLAPGMPGFDPFPQRDGRLCRPFLVFEIASGGINERHEQIDHSAFGRGA